MKNKLFSIVFILAILSSMFSLNAFAAEMTDGTYEVNIALWHSEDDKESMAADSVGTKAAIVVEKGTKTMHITSGEMSMMGIKASLQELRIADAKGKFTDAKVESKDSEGNPTGFYFTMPHTNEYITVKVNPHLAIMGNKDIGARIKVDYSTLKLIKAAEATTAEAESVSEAANGETVTESAAVETVSSQSNNAASEFTETTQATQSKEIRENENNNSAISIAVAVIAVLVVLLVLKKKIKK